MPDTTVSASTHTITPTDTKPPLSTCTMDNLKDRIRPKEIQLTQFIDDCKEWWHHTHPKMFKSKPEYYRDRQAARLAVLKHMPLKEHQVKEISYFLPNPKARVMKSPSMSFGWVIGADEIKALGERENISIMLEAFREDDFEFVYSPQATLDALMHKATKTLPLDKKYLSGCFFRSTRIVKDFDEDEKETYFVSIYGNSAFIPGREGLIPGPGDIKKVQDWLGLGGREPGWWFSRPFFDWTTWEEYVYYCGHSLW